MPFQLTESGTAILTEYGEVVTDVALLAPGIVPQRLALDAVLAESIFLGTDAGPQWGLFFNSGIIAIAGETVVAFDYRREANIADFPIEAGSFGSYNKVQRPFDVKLTIAQADTIDARTTFIEQCESALDSLDLYFAITPEFYFPNINVVELEYRRTRERGCSMIVAELRCVQVRPVQTGQTSTVTANNAATVADPSSANSVSGGTQNAQTPTAAQTSQFNAEHEVPPTQPGRAG